MIKNLDIFSFFITAAFYLWFSMRTGLKLRAFKSQQVMIGIFIFASGALCIAELLVWLEIINIFTFRRILKACLGLNFSILLALVSLISIQANDSAKIKTLWRIPIIGLLAAMYLEFRFVKYMILGHIVVMFIIVFKQRNHFRYLIKKMIPIVLAGVFLYFLNPLDLLMVNVFILFSLLASSSLLNLANVNGLVRSWRVSSEN